MARPELRLVWAILLCGALSLVGLGSAATAEDLAPGTVINKGNIDQMLDKTFEGKTIKSMLPAKMEWWIREGGLAIPLRKSEPIPIDPRWVEATKKFASSVKFDPQTRDVTGYKAGLAFPEIDPNDPHAGIKVMWNLYLHAGYPRPNFQFIPTFAYLMIDGNSGIERNMTWAFLKVWFAGNLAGEPVTNEKIYYQQVLLAREPYDIRGIGTFRIRYNGGKLDDGWAYLRSVRRTRRVSGGAWSDPIGGTDQLNDEISIYSAYPTWYPNYKFLGKRWMLAVTHSPMAWEPDASDAFPVVDYKNAPYWNPKMPWEPREVYVVEATLPEEHVFSKRIYYVDAETWVPYFSECYDKRNELTKLLFNCNRPFKGSDAVNSWGLEETSGWAIDLKRKHCTIFLQGPASRRNPPLGPDDCSLSVMEAIAQGKYQQPSFPEPSW
jgi:hypothetical protein